MKATRPIMRSRRSPASSISRNRIASPRTVAADETACRIRRSRSRPTVIRKFGPGPMAAIRFKWTVRREDNGEYYVDETIGENSTPIVSGPMTRDAAIRMVDESRTRGAAAVCAAQERNGQRNRGRKSGPQAKAAERNRRLPCGCADACRTGAREHDRERHANGLAGAAATCFRRARAASSAGNRSGCEPGTSPVGRRGSSDNTGAQPARAGDACAGGEFAARPLAHGREARQGSDRAVRRQSLRIFGRRQVEPERRAGPDQHEARQDSQMEGPHFRSEHRQHL